MIHAKYTFLDMKNNKRMYIIFFIQMVVVIALMNSVFNTIFETNKYIHSNKILTENKAYAPIDKSSSSKIDYMMNSSSNTISKLQDLYSSIVDNDEITLITHYYYYLNEYIDGKQTTLHYVNEDFNNMFPLEVISGSSFNKDIFYSDDNEIPILVGYNLKNIYAADNVYSIESPIDGQPLNLKVIGILKYNSIFKSINYGMDQYLNNSIIIPSKFKSPYQINDFSELDLSINNSFIITSDLT